MKFNKKVKMKETSSNYFFPRGKKGMTWQQLVLGILALVVVFLVIYWFSGGGTKAFGEIGKKISGTGDCDGDKIANLFDKCKCDASIGQEWTESTKNTKICPHICTSDEKKNCDKCGKLSCS